MGNNKTKFEASILSLFLADKNLTYALRNKSDSDHDGWALKGEHKVAELELTRYVVDGGSRGGSRRRMAVGLWNSKVWPRIRTQRCKQTQLRRVMAAVEFSDNPPRKHDTNALADQIVKIATKAWADRDAQEPLPRMQPEPVTSVFIEDRTWCTSNFQQFGTAYVNVDPKLYPLVAAHIQQIHLTQWSGEWPEWWGPDMCGGSACYCSNSLLQILEEKTRRLGNRGSTGLPAWLVILCDRFDDVRTMIYPCDENERQAIESLFASCGYDFTSCPFDKIWLMSQAYGHSMQVWTGKERYLKDTYKRSATAELAQCNGAS